MSPSWLRPTRAVVDQDAIRHNVEVIAATVAPAKVGVVVKADGYGHGAAIASRAALAGGATWLMVATADEAIELRSLGIDAPILVLSRQRGAALDVCVQAGVSLTVDGHDAVDEASAMVAAAGSGSGRTQRGPVPVHLKVDTGMHRVGCRPDDAIEIARAVERSAHVMLAGVWTHFACADELDRRETDRQLADFSGLIESMSSAGIDPGVVHASNSAGSLGRADARFDLVRVGLAAWGVQPADDIAHDLGLRPALSLESRVTAVRTVVAGDGISYGHRYITTGAERIATVCIGYADGVRRDAGLCGVEVLIGGRRRPIRGTVTMDQLMVGVDDSVEVGDEVVLIGRQGAEEITASEIADRLGTIAYEVLVSIGERVPRVVDRDLTAR